MANLMIGKDRSVLRHAEFRPLRAKPEKIIVAVHGAIRSELPHTAEESTAVPAGLKKPAEKNSKAGAKFIGASHFGVCRACSTA
jgi:hypothetical protein